MPPAIFHRGELLAQQKAGTTGVAHELGQGITDTLALSSGVSRLFQQTPLVIISTLDTDDNLWVRAVFREKGQDVVIRAGEEGDGRVLEVYCGDDGGEVGWELRVGGFVGVLVIDFGRRVRYRVTGVVERRMKGGWWAVRVREAFWNCPKYIQRRVLVKRDVVGSEGKVRWEVGGEVLGDWERGVVERCDTMFFGSYYGERGCDVNHRGGGKGFVRVEDDGKVLWWPEYRGNGMFQSDGNLEVDERAGLLFIDFETGDLVQVSGKGKVEWDMGGFVDGVRRRVVFKVEKVVRGFGVTDLRWKLVDFSPYNPSVSGKSENEEEKEFPMMVTLVKIIRESPSVKTFRFLTPRIVSFLPGQYATFIFQDVPSLKTADTSARERTWTISETPNSIKGDNSIEISVKKKLGGLVSTWLHEGAELGLKVKLMGIDGEMTPITRITDQGNGDANGGSKAAQKFVVTEKLLLISGGIGITPNLAIVRGLGAFRLKSDVVFLHSERFEEELPFQRELRRRVKEYGKLHLVNTISGCAQVERLKDPELNRCGRLSKALIQKQVKDLKERVVYLCGPELFMQIVSKILVELGVEGNNIHIEKFDF